MISNRLPVVSEVIAEHRGLAVLRILRAAGHSANDSILMDVLRRYGIASTRAVVRECIERLKEAGLVTTGFFERVLVVTLTERGEDIALGRTTVPGILHPSPDCEY
ncbi:ArsR family transcriptional regulator [Arenibaculum sp.]|jgi:hypothetical protein|uniref:VpaChn25_0724 family phage protein n=1 Tax=Arenibaculum sp. TaxID=2865862 RepID=UPI002E150CA1|nr:ArsR family transcriptional regulator [Arenibaculum sp.]